MASQMIKIADKLSKLLEKSEKLSVEIKDLIKLQSLEAQRQLVERNKTVTTKAAPAKKITGKRGRPAKKTTATKNVKKTAKREYTMIDEEVVGTPK